MLESCIELRGVGLTIWIKRTNVVKGGVMEDFIGVKIHSATQFRRTMLGFDVLGRDLWKRRRRRRKWR